jgi:hypothetical protein
MHSVLLPVQTSLVCRVISSFNKTGQLITTLTIEYLSPRTGIPKFHLINKLLYGFIKLNWDVSPNKKLENGG